LASSSIAALIGVRLAMEAYALMTLATAVIHHRGSHLQGSSND
jgi:hypothetical protein